MKVESAEVMPETSQKEKVGEVVNLFSTYPTPFLEIPEYNCTAALLTGFDFDLKTLSNWVTMRPS